MNIQEVMRAATETQENVRRASWGTGQLRIVSGVILEPNKNPRIYMTLADLAGKEWRPTPDDLIADDWELCGYKIEPVTVETPKPQPQKRAERPSAIQTAAIWAVLFSLCTAVGFILARVL